MATGPIPGVLRHLRRASALRDAAGWTDGQLLESFLARREEAAFEALVKRHGPMVLGVCRRVLHNGHDAEDAFQATFLVLVRKAHVIRPRDMVGNWLHGVAYRTALRARSAAALRRTKERQARAMPQIDPLPDDTWRDVQPLLDQELNGLPDKYRAAIVLCDLEGKTRKEAARQLGWPEGTLSCRLARGRALLGQRLARRGLTTTGAALAVTLAEGATAAVPSTLLAGTVRVALPGASVTANVAALATGVLKAMLFTKLKVGAALVLVLGFLVAGAGVLRARVAVTASESAAVDGTADDGKEPATSPAEGHTVPGAVRRDEDQDVWQLNFLFKDPRVIQVDVPGRGRLPCWYLRYEIRNHTGKPRTCIPALELTTVDKATGKTTAYHDEVLPPFQEAIRKLEDPSGALDLKNSITIAAAPMPATKNDSRAAAVQGVATWNTLLPDQDRCLVFVSGLSNDWRPSPTKDGALLRKTLQLEFRRVGNEMRFVAPPQWVYRPAAAQPPPLQRADKKALEEKQRALYMRAIQQAYDAWMRGEREVAVQKVVKRVTDALNQLKQEAPDERLQLEVLREIETLVQGLQADVHRRKAHRLAAEKLQGVWQLKKIQINGNLPPELVPWPVKGGAAVGIFGDRFMVKGGADPEKVPLFRLDPKHKPPAIDFDLGGKVFPAVYELQGDTLRICFGDGKTRPTECKAGSGSVLVTYQRKK